MTRLADERLRGLHILVVDDQEADIRLLQKILARAGYTEVEGLSDPTEIPDRMGPVPPDLILLDLHMPRVDGFAVLAALGRHTREDAYLPVIVLSGDMSTDAKLKALALGAKDFLTKPFDVEEVVLRVGNVLETRRLHKQLRSANRDLEARAREPTDGPWN